MSVADHDGGGMAEMILVFEQKALPKHLHAARVAAESVEVDRKAKRTGRS